MNNKKILYISIVDWNWIKQRPQIIAEELASNYYVYYVYPKFYKRETLVKNNNKNPNLELVPRFKIPFSAKVAFLKKIDSALGHLKTRNAIRREKPNVVYLSHPDDYYKSISSCNSYIIYDCMDNYSEFEIGKRKQSVIEAEKKLCEKADCILVSSQFLFDKIEQYNIDKQKIHLVRNGYAGELISVKDNVNVRKSGKILKIVYFGTVSTWFDFEIIEKVIEKREDIEFHIAGPLDRELPHSQNIIYDGIIPHEQLYDYVRDCDALIMPFIVNKIVEAVDPVKLYEYINFNKPIISVYYREIERFKEFLYFYTDFNSLIDSIDNALQNGIRYANQDRIRFLEGNSWSKRGEEIASIIDAEVK